MSKRKKKFTLLFLLFILTGISIGFSLLSTQLKINGVSGIRSNSWDIYWDSGSVDVTTGSVLSTEPIVDEDKTEVSYNVTLELPGDFYEFTIDAVNNGTVDAMIDKITTTVKDSDDINTEFESYIKYSVTYADNLKLKNKHILKKRVNENTPTREKIKVRIEYDKDAKVLPDTDLVYKISTKIDYIQADNTAKDPREAADFVDDSFEDIITSYNAGKIEKLEEAMNNGTTREIQLDLDLDGESETTKHIRIANLTKCSQVNVESKSSCGLVIEFADIINNHPMNSTSSNLGGWKDSEMRTYLNSSIAGTASIYNALPVDLRNVIIPTTLVSGHGSDENTNFTTSDRLYLLSIHEIFNDIDGDPNSGYDYIDTSYYSTRQLDYYTTHNAVKNGYWWLRAATSFYNYAFIRITSGGADGFQGAYNNEGVSPAFRLAE